MVMPCCWRAGRCCHQSVSAAFRIWGAVGAARARATNLRSLRSKDARVGSLGNSVNSRSGWGVMGIMRQCCSSPWFNNSQLKNLSPGPGLPDGLR